MDQMATPKYDVIVTLSGNDGNAFYILGRVKSALREHFMLLGMNREARTNELELFMEEATEGDYDQLLQTCMRWVNVE